ncbi:MAG: Flp pilus assembly complex ATPase component TadA [Candidatus Portnoybacteria bacterium]|nr:Flp pilus assembly complex ATPase component TadA [Candidatus Portnoybacteria bacterium]
MQVDPSQLKAFLADSGILTEVQLKEAEKAAKKTNEKLPEALVKQGLVKPEELSRLQAYILGIPFVNLEEETVPKEVLQIIPEPIARKHNIVAFRKMGKNLEVAMLDPNDLQTIEFIKKKAGLKIMPRLTSQESIKFVLKQYQKSLEAEFGELIDKEAKTISVIRDVADETAKEDLEKAAQDLPIVNIIDSLLKHAILQKASDIHIEPSEKEVIVRYRIDGILHDTMVLPKQVEPGIVARIKVLANLKLDEHRLPQDGRFKVETEEYKFSFRVSILPVYNGEKIVMRLLPEDSKGLTLETLGFHGEALEKMHGAIKKPNGMVLVTGPTGSGKTTTLYTVMDIINTPEVNISTVEDPIEFRMPRINQTQVNPKIGLTFANGLRSLVRQDPDIIMVGEIRDVETASLAVNAALTGHLVLSTLHTNSAAGALPRLIDMKVEPFLIASTTNCIIAQRLVRLLHPEAREKYNLSEAEVKSLGEQFNLEEILGIMRKEKVVKEKDDWSDIDFYKPKQTGDFPSGYKGRIGIYELLEVTEPIKSLIISRATSDQIEDQAKKEGMITMLQDGFIKAAQGLTSIEEILRVTKE